MRAVSLRVKSAFLFAAAASMQPQQSEGHPALPANGHLHNATTILWELDGVKDGSSAHNHRSNQAYNGAFTEFGPYSVGACWDNKLLRVSTTSHPFSKGHCFINDGILSGFPSYYIEGSVPSSAYNRIVDAFEAWSEINSDTTRHMVGLSFAETSSSSEADIIVRWVDLPATANGGQVTLIEGSPLQYLEFDSSISNWSFQKSPNGIPASDWHFYSVALHEVGHVVGLAHQADTGDIMAGAGRPIAQGGPQYAGIDGDSIIGARQLYSQPVGPATLANACTITLEFNGCPGGASPSYIATVIDNSGASGTTMVDLDYRVGSSTIWKNLANSTIGCFGYSSSVGVVNRFRAVVLTSIGVGECAIEITPSANLCDGDIN